MEGTTLVIDRRLWSLIRCYLCGVPAGHALEFELRGVPALVGACDRHFAAVRRLAKEAGLRVVESEVLEPKGVG